MKLEPMSTKYNSYLTDESRYLGSMDDIAFPENKEDIVSALKDAAANNKKVTLQGARTGLCGAAAPNGGRALNLTLLNKMGDVETENGESYLTCECGVTLDEAAKKAQSKRLLFPVNPTEETATLGGMFSTNASGPNCILNKSFSRYIDLLSFITPKGEEWNIKRGEYKVSDNILPLPNGEKIDLSKLSNKLPFDFCEENEDLIDFLAGKEGYFGVAESMKIRLLKESADLWGIVFFFEDESKNIEFSKLLKEMSFEGAKLAAAEFYSEQSLNLIKENLKNPLLTSLPELPENVKTALYVELLGDSEETSEEALMQLLDSFSEVGGLEEHTWAENGKEAVKRFRDMRHAVVSILNESEKIHSKTKKIRFEADFKLYESFEDSIKMYNEELKKSDLKAAVYGSILENHLHIALLCEDEDEKAQSFIEEMSKKVYSLGGKLSSKYGVGKIKRDTIMSLLSDSDREELIKIRKIFDPDNIMNP